MPRSAEQEILFQKLLKFLDKYRGKNGNSFISTLR